MDKHIDKAIDQSISQHSMADDLCTVCYSREPNTVFMPCGHGGICDECAVGIFEKADHCPFCRKVGYLNVGNSAGARD